MVSKDLQIVRVSSPLGGVVSASRAGPIRQLSLRSPAVRDAGARRPRNVSQVRGGVPDDLRGSLQQCDLLPVEAFTQVNAGPCIFSPAGHRSGSLSNLCMMSSAPFPGNPPETSSGTHSDIQSDISLKSAESIRRHIAPTIEIGRGIKETRKCTHALTAYSVKVSFAAPPTPLAPRRPAQTVLG